MGIHVHDFVLGVCFTQGDRSLHTIHELNLLHVLMLQWTLVHLEHPAGPQKNLRLSEKQTTSRPIRSTHGVVIYLLSKFYKYSVFLFVFFF